MTPEELMKPRYKVIADYPGSEIQVGDILMEGFILSKPGWYSQNGKKIHGPEFFPHLFQPLQWWEERKPEDMPEYVRVTENADAWGVIRNRVYKVIEWHGGYVEIGGDRAYKPSIFLPATETEYQQYLTSKH